MKKPPPSSPPACCWQPALPRKTPLETVPLPKAHKIPFGTNSTAARIKPTTAACSPCASKLPRVSKC